MNILHPTGPACGLRILRWLKSGSGEGAAEHNGAYTIHVLVLICSNKLLQEYIYIYVNHRDPGTDYKGLHLFQTAQA